MQKKITGVLSAVTAAFAYGALALVVLGQSGGPVISNQLPAGTVTAGNVTISLDTADLATCRYNSTDVDYGSMEGVMTSPDGLSHTASLGALANGSYTYYVRCKDFAQNANSSSQVIQFNVGSATVVQPTPVQTAQGPKITKTSPTGTLYQEYATLSVVTDVAAECRFSSYNRSFDAMTLVFESGDQLTHTYDISLSSYGYKTFYVLCKDDSGNVGKSAKITFNYKSLAPDNPVITPKADTTAPVIDPASLAPTGTVTATPAILTVKTDEAATCKYDVTDISYDTMANTFDPATDGTTYTKSVVLGDAGPYVYYIRCKDAAGNADTASSQITFTYTKAQAPVISGTQPTNNSNVYQSQVGLQVNTDVASDCRYSTADMDYDAMQDGFNTSDNLLHQANVNLNNVGPYIYYVRCKSKDGAKNDTSTVINFQYEVQTTGDQTTTSPPSATVTMGTSDGKCNMAQDNICDPDCPAAPDPGADPDCANLPQTTQSGQTPTITMGVKDGECNNAQDYVCDPDCPPAPDSDADPDCANIKKSGGGVALVLLIIGILVIVAIVAVVIILKKRGAEEESIETLE